MTCSENKIPPKKRPFLYTQNYFILYEFNSDSCANINTFFEITTIFGSLTQ